MAEAIGRSIFRGERIFLSAIDPEKDAALLAGWTHDTALMRAVDPDHSRPQTAAQIKKRINDQSNAEGQHEFLIRMQADDRVIGFVRLEGLQWIHGTAMIRLGIADAADRRRGYGREALGLIMHYAFGELNLHRLGATCPGYNSGAITFLERMGFQTEVQRREALHRDGRRWNRIHLGILAREWQEARGG